MILIYGKPDCKYCERAKELCESSNLEYEYLEIVKDFTRDELLKKFPDAKTFPQITISGKAIGGYDQLTRILLDRVLHIPTLVGEAS